MNWLNIEVGTIRRPEYVGADPIHRATWLNLMCYCAEQENGGLIVNCAEWKCRRWQQTCGVTKAEVSDGCDLWEIVNDDLSVWGYPTEKEMEVSRKRQGGRTGGLKRAENSKLKGAAQAELEALLEAELQRKRREEKRKEEEGKETPPPPAGQPDIPNNPNRIATYQQLIDFAASQPIGISEDCCNAFFDRMEADGWVNKEGFPLADWRPRFRSWATSWIKNSANPNKNHQ